MGVTKYQAEGKTYWRVDEWVSRPDGTRERFRQKRIPTREQAMALAAKVRTEAFEGRHFNRSKAPTLTVREAWELYEPAGHRNDSWQTDQGRAKHLLRHLGERKVASLNVGDVDAYRTARLLERTQRKQAPTPATLDREMELLKRVLNYAVGCRKLSANPIAAAKFLRVPNVRRTVIDAQGFERLLDACEEALRPIVLVAFDTGMRKREVLNLRWEQVDLRAGTIRLAQQDTKGEEARVVILTSRTRAALEALPRGIGSVPVFRNPETGEPWQDIRKAWRRALEAAGLRGVWVHDLRRSFVTRARKAGVPESVVMRMSGHRTRAVFDRYNIVEESDLRRAVEVLEGQDTLRTHPQEKGQKHEGAPA